LSDNISQKLILIKHKLKDHCCTSH